MLKVENNISIHLLGLKLWSSNAFYIGQAQALFEQGIFDYIELYVLPGTEKEFLHEWQALNIPFSLHAPHSYHGLNFSLKELEAKNRELIKEVETFQKALSPRHVVFHPGIEGSLEESLRQMEIFAHEFKELFHLAVIENKPKIGLKGEICVGASPEEIERILKETGLGFCFDFGHAICYAAWKKSGGNQVVDQFLALKPKVIHLSDGDVNSEKDMHLNFNCGNFNLGEIIHKIPVDVPVSIETHKASKENLDDFLKDAVYFRECAKNG